MTTPRRWLRAVQRVVPPASGPGCTVLGYHLVGAGTGSPVDLPLGMFRRQMGELAESAEVLPLEQALTRVRLPADRGPSGASDRPVVVLTFDDAYRNFHQVAFPILAELGLPATLFVPVGFVEGDHPPPMASAPLPATSWSELREMVASGLVTVGSHSWSHPANLPRLPEKRLDRELKGSRERLEDRLEAPARSFCYPRGLWSRGLERRVGRVYDLAMIGGGRRFEPGRTDPLRIERVPLRADGPISLAPVLRSRVWIEEWVADRFRRLRG